MKKKLFTQLCSFEKKNKKKNENTLYISEYYLFFILFIIKYVENCLVLMRHYSFEKFLTYYIADREK